MQKCRIAIAAQPSDQLCQSTESAVFSLFYRPSDHALLFMCSLSATEIPGQSPEEEKVHACYINAPRTRIDSFDTTNAI
jgi:hypothetical protein